MKPFSPRVTESPRSGIRTIFDLTLQMDDVISFAVGEPSFPSAPHIQEAGAEAIARSGMRYTDVGGVRELRQAVAAYTAEHKGVSYDPDSETQITHGATAALSLAFTTLVRPGSEVILGSPYFATYENMVITAGGRPVSAPLRPESGFRHEADAIEQAITPSTSVIVINSPSNPTGAVTPAGGGGAGGGPRGAPPRRDDLWVVSDEVYHRYVYGDTVFASIAASEGMRERTVLIDSFSKTYAMTGWRIGYMHGPASFISETGALAEAVTSSNNAATQLAAIAALTGPQDQLAAMRDAYAENRQIVIDAVLGASPALALPSAEGAFYAFIDVSATGMSSTEFAMRLLEDTHVAVVPGDAFGRAGDGYVRVSYVGDRELVRAGMSRLADFAVAAADRRAATQAV